MITRMMIREATQKQEEKEKEKRKKTTTTTEEEKEKENERMIEEWIGGRNKEMNKVVVSEQKRKMREIEEMAEREQNRIVSTVSEMILSMIFDEEVEHLHSELLSNGM